MGITIINLKYEKSDLTKSIAPYVKSFSYTDNEGGKADDLQLSLEDADDLWKGAWFPTKGSVLKAKVENRVEGKKYFCNCGTFEIDEISVEGSPDTITLKGISSLTSKAIKTEKKYNTFNNKKLSEIADKIAGDNELACFFLAEDLAFKRLEQRGESDLTFLKRICDRNDINLKIKDETLILFETEKLEDAKPVAVIKRGISPVSRYNFTTKTYEIFKACTVSYWDAEERQEKKYTFIPPGAPLKGEVCKINKRVESMAAAKAMAKKTLRGKNKHEVSGQLEVYGDTRLLSGLSILCEGFGVFDGKYMITEATHTYDLNSGYRTSLNLRKVMAW